MSTSNQNLIFVRLAAAILGVLFRSAASLKAPRLNPCPRPEVICSFFRFFPFVVPATFLSVPLVPDRSRWVCNPILWVYSFWGIVLTCLIIFTIKLHLNIIDILSDSLFVFTFTY